MIHYQVYKNQNTTKWVTFVHGAGAAHLFGLSRFGHLKKCLMFFY